MSRPHPRPLRDVDAPAAAAIHNGAFERNPWTADDFRRFLLNTGYGFISGFDGVILLQQAGGESEILTLAVAPHARRRGVGRALVEAGVRAASARNDLRVHLEVAASNAAARALYAALKFQESGLRPGYYRDGQDALTLMRDLRP